MVISSEKSELPARCLILWWGSLKLPGTTVGDCMAAANVALALQSRGIDYEVACYKPFPVKEVKTISTELAAPERYKAVCFVCGPLKSNLLELIKRYRRLSRFAAGVSLLPGEEETNRLFDKILPREGEGEAIFDLALADSWRSLFPEKNPLHGKSIALCFRGSQTMKGPVKTTFHDLAEPLLEEAAAEWRNGGAIIYIKTTGNELGDILRVSSQLDDSRLVLTTRLHGALLALERGIPFIAVDQMPGGHKVERVLKKIGWPYVFNAWELNEVKLRGAIEKVTAPEFMPRLLEFREEARRLSNLGLERTVRMIEEVMSRKP